MDMLEELRNEQETKYKKLLVQVTNDFDERCSRPLPYRTISDDLRANCPATNRLSFPPYATCSYHSMATQTGNDFQLHDQHMAGHLQCPPGPFQDFHMRPVVGHTCIPTSKSSSPFRIKLESNCKKRYFGPF